MSKMIAMSQPTAAYLLTTINIYMPIIEKESIAITNF